MRQADAHQLLDQARTVIDSIDQAGNGRVRAVVSGVETMGCSDELLAGIAELTAAREIPTHLHSHVSEAAVRAHAAAFGRTATQRLSAAGMLSPRCTLMHAGSLTDEDIAVFAETGLTVNYNPGGNALFGFGTTAGRSVPRLLDAGVPVVLGSDTAPSFAVSTPFDMIHAALILQRDLAGREDALSLEQALAMATHSGPSLGRTGQLGRVAEGQLADLVLVDITGPHHLGTDHPIPALALHARTADIAMVIVDGHIVVEHGDLVGVDEAALSEAARQARIAIAAH